MRGAIWFSRYQRIAAIKRWLFREFGADLLSNTLSESTSIEFMLFQRKWPLAKSTIEILQLQNLRVTFAYSSLLPAYFVKQDTGGDCGVESVRFSECGYADSMIAQFEKLWIEAECITR